MPKHSWLISWLCCQGFNNSDWLQLPKHAAIEITKMTRIKYRIWLLISAPKIGHYISQMCVVTTALRRKKLSGVELSRAERLEDETGLRRSLTCSSLLLKEVRIQPPYTGIHSIHIISYSSSTPFLLFSLRVRTALRFMQCSQSP